MKFLDIKRWLLSEGYTIQRCKGSHFRFRHPELGCVTVPMQPGGKDMHGGLVAQLRMQVKRAKEGRQWHQRDYDSQCIHNP